MSRARSVALPLDSAIAPLFADADLADAYAVGLPDTAGEDVMALARSVLARPPAWIGALMAVRNGAMAAVGVKSAGDIRHAAERRGTEVVGSFPVKERRAREVVMGADDRHLDFSTSFLIRDATDGRELVWVTAVHCHNRLGRTYLTVISPFHRAIVKTFLARASRSGWIMTTRGR